MKIFPEFNFSAASIHHFLCVRARVLGVLSTLLLAITFIGSLWWPLEITTHFIVFYACAGLALAMGQFLLKDYRWASLTLVTAAIHFAFILPVYLPASTTPHPDAKPIKLLLSNILSNNPDHQTILDLIKAEDPDFIVLQEVGLDWFEELEALAPDYPGYRIIPREDMFGLAQFTRLPIEKVENAFQDKHGVPALSTTLTHDSKPLHILNMHTLPPGNAEYAATRNAQLQDATDWANAHDGPRIIIGDLNTTPWSPYFRKLMAATGLKDARRGFGILPSWPTIFPYPIQIPLDQILVSPDIHIHDIRLGPNIGSDHYPLIIELSTGTPES